MSFKSLFTGPSGHWSRFAGGGASALLLSLAMPGLIGWWLLLFFALIPLLSVALHETPLRSGVTGLWAGFLYHVVLLYWIVIVLGKYGGLPLWISVPALLLLAFAMSCYTALFCALLSLVAGRSWHKERPMITLVWSAPFLWVGIDWLRGQLFTGFPWMDISYGLFAEPHLIQAADLGGHHLVTFCIVLLNGLIFYFFKLQKREIHWNFRVEKRLALLFSLFLVFIGGYSQQRFHQVASLQKKALQARIAVIQGNISQDQKWTDQQKEKTVLQYQDLTEQVLIDPLCELVVWPETAMPFFPQYDSALFSRVACLARERNIWLLSGVPFVVEKNNPTADSGQYDFFNSALLINPQGQVAGRYDKKHLVPFGEYVPMRRALPFLEPLVQAVGDFTKGTIEGPLRVGPLKLGVLICFESIFPEIAREHVVSGSNVLINLTNDAWYGRSSAPYQTLAMSVFRAVENRRSLVRSANTGISCFVDPVGRIVKHSPLFEPAALVADVPVMEKSTLFLRSGYVFGPLCLFMAALLLLRRIVRKY